jgi:hypothetical protein
MKIVFQKSSGHKNNKFGQNQTVRYICLHLTIQDKDTHASLDSTLVKDARGLFSISSTLRKTENSV